MLIERHISDSSAVALWFLLLFLMFAFLFRYGNRRLQDIVAAFFSDKVLVKKQKEEYFMKNYPSLFMFIMAWIAIGLSIYFPLKNTLNIPVVGLYVALFLLPWIKVLVVNILSVIISPRATIFRPLYLLDFISYQTAGLFLVFALPLLLWISPEQFLNVVLGILSFFIFYRIMRGLIISIKAKAPLFYIILYFCALELLPLLFLVKVITIS
jgi:hypothetical protein